MTGDRVQDATVANAKTTSRQTYGASVGGPIIKNKLFFFINGELEYKSFLGNQWQPSTDGVGSAENKLSTDHHRRLGTGFEFPQREGTNYDPGAYQNFGNSAVGQLQNHGPHRLEHQQEPQADGALQRCQIPGRQPRERSFHPGRRPAEQRRPKQHQLHLVRQYRLQAGKPRAFDHGRVEQRLQPEGLEQAARFVHEHQRHP